MKSRFVLLNIYIYIFHTFLQQFFPEQMLVDEDDGDSPTLSSKRPKTPWLLASTSYNGPPASLGWC